MKLTAVIDKYVTHRRALGMQINSDLAILKAFSRALGDIHIGDIALGHVMPFIFRQDAASTFLARKHQALAIFYRFAVGRGYVRSSPLPTKTPQTPPSLVPYIYSADEMRRLLAATEILERRKRIVEATTFRTLLLTLYGTGLRIREALSLALADVDLPANLLTIRCSKFYKTRLVPTGPKLTAALSSYAKHRLRQPCPIGKESVFFATRRGESMAGWNCHYADWIFRKLCNHAGIRRSGGGRYQTRLHDIRHTFAVHRLIAWYREGADLQRMLPKLATYLGHVDIVSTQRYLSMTPDLLSEARLRFERYATLEVSHD